MNILVVAHYQGDGSPSAIFVHSQILAYARLGHSVRAIVPIAFGKRAFDGSRFFPSVSHQTIDGVPHAFVRYISWSRFGNRNFNTARALGAFKRHYREILEDFVPDVIHAHTLGFDSELGVWLRERLRCPLVVTTHGSDTVIPIKEGRGQELKRFADKADTVVGVSSKLTGALEKEKTTAPLKVILNGFHPPSEKIERKKTLLSFNQTSSLIEQKKTDVTIRAFAALRLAHPEALLTIVGQGSERPALEKLCKTLGVSECVRFLGWLDNREAQREMAKAQFFVMPSVGEGFGIVYLEAMAAGCIAIGTEGEGIADFIRSGENGFLVPPDDSAAIVQVVEWCLQNPKQAAEIAERGRQEALGMTWKRNAEEYLRLFTVLLEWRKPD